VGDLARRLPDGRIQFVGRRDKQLKVNGFRIEASEIANSMPSNVLRSHVMVQNGILVAYVMPEVDKDVVISSLEERLPTYMVPRIVVPLSTFPLNKNGKIDIEALLVAGQELAQSSIADVAEDELGPTENIIRLVWMQVLHRYSVSELSVHDNFFEKGGTSLSAVVMSRKLSLELHMEVSVQDIFAYQTIRSLAVALDETQQSIRTPNPPDPLDYLSGGRERLHPIFFGALQGLGLIIMSLLVVGPVLATVSVSVRAFLWFGNLGFLLFPVFLVAGCCLHMGLALFCKWTIIGRYKSGKARLYSWMFLKWWLVRRILHVTSLYTWIFDETSFSRVWLSLLGVRIGQNVLVEQPYILEADLVTIGDDCVLEFEVQLATSEIVGGMLELRPVIIGKRVKLGVRAVVLGGATVHDGVQLLAKASVDSTYSSTSANQVISGSPGHIVGETGGDLWRPRRGNLYNLLQMTAGMLQLLVLEASIYPAASIGLAIFNRLVPS
jgi:serine acetyltransferase